MTPPDNNDGGLTPIRPFQSSPMRVAPTEDQAGPGRNPTDLDARIRTAEARLRLVIRALNSASISAICNEDGTITVTLTVPGLPSS